MENIDVDSPRPKVSALAIWSLVLGKLSAIGFCFTGIPAVICGAMEVRFLQPVNGELYHHVPGNRDIDSRTVLIYSDPISPQGKLRTVGYSGGQAITLPEEEFNALQLE